MNALRIKPDCAMVMFSSNPESSLPSALLIRVQGLVQGVGFRPFVYRIALQNHIRGWVENNNEGVLIHAEATPRHLETFLHELKQLAPPASDIRSIEVQDVKPIHCTSFEIRKSSNLSDAITAVSPDIAVCPECLADMREQQRRLNYPFTNCTNCGPRFTIIIHLPYDRQRTTMASFEMCPDCYAEYTNILDRRFHAQPVACSHCGPQYWLPSAGGRLLSDPAGLVAEYINQGKIVALKGLGGFHLLCDAKSQEAVNLLRNRKKREHKPFAVMVPDLSTAKKYFSIDPTEEQLLCSWRRPIVLLKNILPLAPATSNGLHTTGVMLPYMPLHHMLFKRLNTDVVVFTSGNISDEPVVIADDEAVQKLSCVADVVVGYNRLIHNRADDSVVFVAGDKSLLIRRSRSYVPEPIDLAFDCEGLLATGAELNNTFALGKARQAILSQHIGDLKNAPTLEFFEQSLERFSRLFRFKPKAVACDLHPDYLSTRYAQSLGLPVIAVQHHHAHMASCMAEHRIEEKVIALIFDGTGLGTDGSIWGGECLVGDLVGFERLSHIEPVPLPGGDKVIYETWRTAMAYLWKYFGAEAAIRLAEQQQWCKPEVARHLVVMLEKHINCPLSSGAGRFFDAVAALCGLCTYAGFHAEAPMKLEAAAIETSSGYQFDFSGGVVGLKPVFEGLLADLSDGLPIAVVSGKFHRTLAELLVQMANDARQQTGLTRVVLSGGTFQNRRLLEMVIPMLEEHGYEAFVQQKVPCNDGGIALGQMAVAAARLKHA